ncbi:MAG: beta-ketoacyl-[acyl-carrier-protein] synthase family protein [Phycisphaerae bacterium]
MASDRRVVITGLGVASPIGIGIEPFWDALIRKESGIGRVESFDPGGLPSQVGGELPAFQLGDHIPKSYRKSAKVMSRDIKIAVVAAYHAVRDAGLVTKCIVDRGESEGPPNVASSRFGANIGAGLVCADLTELAGALSTAVDDSGRFDIQTWGREGMSNLTPLWLLKFLPNMLACHVTIVHDAQAPSNTITCSEASSHLAIGEAYRTIARGAADVCICGGAESKMNPMAMARPALCGRLSSDSNDDPTGACRPFGRQASGTVAAEGGGLIILESLEHAKARGARIYAELAGFGASSSIQTWSGVDDGTALSIALRKALADSGTSADDCQLLNPFGTGIPDFDRSELKAWTDVFGDNLSSTVALTTRGALGNNGAGSGALDIAAMAMALNRNTVPVSHNTDDLLDGCGFNFVQGDARDVPVMQAISASYALAGGQCAALVIKKYQEAS